MKLKLVLLSLVLLIGLVLFMFLYQKSSTVKISSKKLSTIFVNDTIINLGKIVLNEKKDVPVRITNTGETLLLIESISSSCSCAEAPGKYPPIAPNQTVPVNIEVKPNVLGIFIQKVFITCNAVNSPVSIIIKGNVEI